ncbi:hypothetical protein SAM23877_0820 [Streptomyces ambofaciens ATCC 23877]|uniref:Uncharacterized protein n=1 Tax=Streptomyces ambofaciens (strain ATCC 23877 / 3486 / DSM 40053 / JCM 4204 / NBRC 12836 / NRRL B-2516) TaxID=278992 RepID=A0A0K2ALJ4_STRA7|nr:hypothetical protein SAM23877_0820 [Streptomyces ambofaciens ATCC 23877]
MLPAADDAGTGPPIGAPFAAGHGPQSSLLRLAGQLERANRWSGRTPAVRAGTDREAAERARGRSRRRAPGGRPVHAVRTAHPARTAAAVARRDRLSPRPVRRSARRWDNPPAGPVSDAVVGAVRDRREPSG